MITNTRLTTLNLPNILAYYSLIASNFTDGKVYLARKQFQQLSPKQRKGYFIHITGDEWNATSTDQIYSYFFEML